MRAIERGWSIGILAVALIVFGAACSGGGAPPPRKGEGLAKQYWQEGGTLARRGQLDAAIRKYEQALEVQPDFLACLNDLGLVFIQKGWYDRALGVFERALDYDEDYVEVRAGMCEAYWHLGNWNQCIAEADRAIKDEPKLPRPYYWRGMANRRLGRNEIAERDLLAAIDHDNKFDLAHLALAELFAENGLYDKAEKRFQAAHDSNPARVQTFLVWAQMKIQQTDYDAAHELLKRAIRQAPQLAAAHTMMGYVYLGKSNRARAAGDEAGYRREAEEAMDRFRTALRFDKVDADAQNGLEEARQRIGGSE